MATPKGLDRLFCGKIFTGSSFLEGVDALGIEDGKVVAMGHAQDLRGLCGAATSIEDLGRGCIAPGFVDPHTHYSITSFMPFMADCRTPPLGSIGEIVEQLRRKAEDTEDGHWVMGWGYDESLLREHRHPVREEMDRACAHHPAILLHGSLHQCVANSLALDLCGIDKWRKEPPGGKIGRDRSGSPNGVLWERAATEPYQLARKDLLVLRDAEIVDIFAANGLRYARWGIVRVADAAVGPLEKKMYEKALAEGRLPIQVDWMEVGLENMFTPPHHLLTGSPNGSASIVKLFLDGAEQCRLEMSLLGMVEGLAKMIRAALAGKSIRLSTLGQTPVKVGRDGKVRLGFFLNDPREILGIVREAHRLGYAIATHALGNGAVQKILEIYRQVQDEYGPPSKPFRIEHALFLTEDLIREMAELKVVAVVQPAFVYQYGSLLQAQPVPRRLMILPLRRMLDAGVLVSGSSDHPCAPEDPLFAMDCAVRRVTRDGDCMDPGQSIRVEEALALYTQNAARASHCQDAQGTLEEGRPADLAILSGDPRALGFHGIRVMETIVAGKTVWKTD